MAAVESRAGVRRDVNGANLLASLRIERIQLVARRKPDMLAVVSDTSDVVDARKRPVFAEYFGARSLHGWLLYLSMILSKNREPFFRIMLFILSMILSENRELLF